MPSFVVGTFGLMAVRSRSETEAGKAGVSALGEVAWRGVWGDRWKYSLSGGLGVVTLQGTTETQKQSVFQTSLTAEQALYYGFRRRTLDLGFGLRHMIAPGSGLEYANSQAGLWSVYLGPRVAYEPSGEHYFLRLGLDSSLLLSGGQGTGLFFAFGYDFTARPSRRPDDEAIEIDEDGSVVEPATAMPAVSPESARSRLNGLSTNESAVADRSRETRFVYNVPSAALATVRAPNSDRTTVPDPIAGAVSGRGTVRLTRRTRQYIADLAYELMTNHPQEWTGIEISCAGHALCSLFVQELAAKGLPAERVELTGGPTLGLRVIVSHNGMIGLFESKDRQWRARQIRALKFRLGRGGEIPGPARADVARVMSRLADDPLTWKSVSLFLPSGRRGEIALARLQAIARKARLERYDFADAESHAVASTADESDVTIEVEAAGPIELLQRTLSGR